MAERFRHVAIVGKHQAPGIRPVLEEIAQFLCSHGLDVSLEADTALNTIVSSIDMVRMSASASKRAFVVETMGRTCGFLPLLGGIAGGAEKAYLPESGITLEQLSADIEALVDAFETGRSFYLAVMGEETSEHYTADVLARLFEAEGRGLYSVRRALIGHVQQGGTPSPFDRINATRLAYQALVNLDRQLQSGTDDYVAAHSGTPGLMAPLRDVTDHMDWERQRPREQWWLRLRAVTCFLDCCCLRLTPETTVRWLQTATLDRLTCVEVVERSKS